MTVTCDWCTADAAWLVFAAYDIAFGAVSVATSELHPQVAHYPAPMIRTCLYHLSAALAADAETPGSTGQWLVRPA